MQKMYYNTMMLGGQKLGCPLMHTDFNEGDKGKWQNCKNCVSSWMI